MYFYDAISAWGVMQWYVIEVYKQSIQTCPKFFDIYGGVGGIGRPKRKHNQFLQHNQWSGAKPMSGGGGGRLLPFFKENKFYPIFTLKRWV